MKIKMAKKYGFCFGVKRAISIAEKTKGGVTFGELIHNKQEIQRLKDDYDVDLKHSVEELKDAKSVIVRTHGIEKNDLELLKKRGVNIVDATCPFVTKPQEIVKKMSSEGYQIIIFGDENHPEVKGVRSYSQNQACVVKDLDELKKLKLLKKIALISQTTKQIDMFTQMATYLIELTSEVRVFNTICNATFENQSAVSELSKEVDIMIIVGGKTSSNTKQLLEISLKFCKDSYLVEDENELNMEWFANKNICGITAGASTPDWIIQKIQDKISQI